MAARTACSATRTSTMTARVTTLAAAHLVLYALLSNGLPDWVQPLEDA
jgi:hypothetical protein